jgi:hypothetical protein
MKCTYRFIRRAMFIAGLIALLCAAGVDQMYTDMRQMPPDSVGTMVAWAFVLMIPQGLHWLRRELRERVKGE